MQSSSVVVLVFAGLLNGVSVFVLAAIAIPWTALLFVGNSIFGPSPIKECKWQHFACFIVLSLSISFLLLAGSGALETIDIGGNKVAFVRQQVKDIKLLAENVADLSLLSTKNAIGSASIDWIGPDLRVIAETRDRTTDLLQKSGTDPTKIAQIRKEFSSEIETSLKREIYFMVTFNEPSLDSLVRTNLFPKYNREQLIDSLQNGGQLTNSTKRLIDTMDYFLRNDRLPPEYEPPGKKF